MLVVGCEEIYGREEGDCGGIWWEMRVLVVGGYLSWEGRSGHCMALVGAMVLRCRG